MSVPYICYAELKEFHTLKEVCELFRMEKRELKNEVRNIRHPSPP